MYALRVALLGVIILLGGNGFPSYGDENNNRTVPLSIDGDTVLIVKSTPFRILAPSGGDFYIWNIPDTIKGSTVDNVLTVSRAAKGVHKIRVVSVTINFTIENGKAVKKIVKDSGEIDVNFGGESPVPPPPPPDPDDPFIDDLKSAYKSETDSSKAENVALLAKVYAIFAAETVASLKDFKTVGGLYDGLVSVSRKTLSEKAIPQVRRVIGKELVKLFPQDASKRNDPITDELAQRGKDLFGRISDGLKSIR